MKQQTKSNEIEWNEMNLIGAACCWMKERNGAPSSWRCAVSEMKWNPIKWRVLKAIIWWMEWNGGAFAKLKWKVIDWALFLKEKLWVMSAARSSAAAELLSQTHQPSFVLFVSFALLVFCWRREKRAPLSWLMSDWVRLMDEWMESKTHNPLPRQVNQFIDSLKRPIHHSFINPLNQSNKRK